MDDRSNPYSAPVTKSKRNIAEQKGETNNQFSFQPIMKRWELLRLLYNGVLILLVMFVTFAVFPARAVIPGYWATIIGGGIVANICFFTGPAVEAYARCFRLWHDVLTYLLFIAGLFFTAIMAIATIAEYPNF